jgi:hypothetical protein
MGRIYCVVEAPDETGLRDSHTDAGLGTGPVREVPGMQIEQRLSQADRATIRALLAQRPGSLSA